ncbi:retrovirus-related pol polyprotein from transposon TNT 1-94 [Tanacetum coccineum]
MQGRLQGIRMGIANPNVNENGNVVAARAEGNGNGNNGNQTRCYNCKGLGHLARNYTVRLRRKDAAYLQTQLMIAQGSNSELKNLILWLLQGILMRLRKSMQTAS